MKAAKPPQCFLSPHMTQVEVNDYMENMMRKEFGPEAELMIMFARTLQKIMADIDVAEINKTERKK
jgi:uncharacterized protein (DUF1697 family)